VASGALVLWRATRISESPTPPTVVRSVAVLPFRVSGSTRDSLSHPFARDLITLLAPVPGLRVAPAASTFAFDERHGIRTLGTLINVGVVLEGDVRRSGKALQAKATLVSTVDSGIVWTKEFHGDTADTRALLSAIAQDVATVLRAELGLPATSLPADSDAARADSLVARADSLSSRGDAAEAERHLAAAVRQNPRLASARYSYSLVLSRSGKHEEAVREARRAHELDPLVAEIHRNYIVMLGRSGNSLEARHETAELRRLGRYLGGNP
jgi:TolB-like protein